MLLELYVARAERRRVSVSSLCFRSLSAPTTALRHIRVMEDAGDIVRAIDRADARRFYLSLSEAASAAVDRVLQDWRG